MTVNLDNWCVWLDIEKKSVTTHGHVNVKSRFSLIFLCGRSQFLFTPLSYSYEALFVVAGNWNKWGMKT